MTPLPNSAQAGRPADRSSGTPTYRDQGVGAWSRVGQALRHRRIAVPLAFTLVAAIGAADYLTGYEVRLAILYVLPLALATWTVGRSWGYLVALLGPATWAASFASLHAYSRDVYFYWDCLAMAVTFLLFVELIARLRAALQRSDERFVRVLEGLYAAVYVTDGSARLLFANRRLTRMLGSETRLPTTREIEARFAIVPADGQLGGEAAAESAFMVAEARDVVEGRWYLVQSGSIPWVDRRRAQLNLLTDITDQKLAHALRREQDAALHHTAQLMSLAEAGGTLAHELNQPLVAIVGFNAACLRLLDADTLDTTELRTGMERLRAQAVRAGDIVHRLRDLTQRRAPQLAPCALNGLITQAVGWAAGDLERAGVTLECDLGTGLPELRADCLLVEQVLLNLVQNAIDAVRDCDAPRRRVRVASAHDGGAAVRVTVADRGTGIDPDVAAHVYDPFFTTRKNGLGLGLSICRSIVEMHGGRIWHMPQPEGGTVFCFTLPVEP